MVTKTDQAVPVQPWIQESKQAFRGLSLDSVQGSRRRREDKLFVLLLFLNAAVIGAAVLVEHLRY